MRKRGKKRPSPGPVEASVPMRRRGDLVERMRRLRAAKEEIAAAVMGADALTSLAGKNLGHFEAVFSVVDGVLSDLGEQVARLDAAAARRDNETQARHR